MKKGKILLFISWISAVGLLIGITLVNDKRTSEFMGLTQTNQKIINYTYPVQLKKLHVLPEQKVKKGDVIAELIRTDLYHNKINILDIQINELNSKIALKKSKLKANLNEIEIEKKAKLSEINDKIEQLKYKTDQNSKLISTLTGEPHEAKGAELKLQSLKKKKKFIVKQSHNKKEEIKYQLNDKNNPIQDEIDKLLEKKRFILQEEVNINVLAPIDGAIDNISFVEGESIKEFQTLMTMHDNYPSYITGYIHENVTDHLKLGQEVEIEYVCSKYKSKIGTINGVIKTIGSKIVKFPVKLKKYKIVPLWGYKVYIQVPKNDLKLGQKVMISSELKEDPFDAKISKILQFLKLK